MSNSIGRGVFSPLKDPAKFNQVRIGEYGQIAMQNNDPAPNSQSDDEISRLDILVVLSENIKLLIIGPILPVALPGGIS